jgi:hypothetical protein
MREKIAHAKALEAQRKTGIRAFDEQLTGRENDES